MDRTFGWELPPGVSERDIPGNRPEDEAWEHAVDKAMLEIVDVCDKHIHECENARFEDAQVTPGLVWAGCSLDIVTEDWERGEGDAIDCPYLQRRAEEIMEEE